MSADWSQLLASAEYLGELYDGSPPPTDACDLFYVHIDEREDSVTLGFDSRAFPVNPLPEWRGKDFNTFEFHLYFTWVTGLRVTGWGATEAKVIDLTVRDGGHFDVTLGSEASGITFRAAAARLARTRAYLARDNQGEAAEEEADDDDQGFADPPGEDAEYQVDQYPRSGSGANRSPRDGSRNSGGEV
jgi:hypothetical protein